MTTYCLDTNICIHALKGSYPALKGAFSRRSPRQIKVPSMVRAELLYGAAKSVRAKGTKKRVEEFLRPYEILPFDAAAL